MWKRYDDLDTPQHYQTDAMYSWDTLEMGQKNVADVRRRYAYWIEGNSVHCRRNINRVDWNQRTLY